MIAKIIALIATVAVVVSADCGYLSTGVSGICGSRVLNVGCAVPVASACPPCSPVAVPAAVIDPIPTTSVVGTVAPVISTGIVSSGLYGSRIYESGLYGSGLYGSGYYGSSFGGCGCGSVSTLY